MIDWFLGLLSPIQWESWRNWLATIGGLVALFIAANTYSRNVRVKREEQARLVYSSLGRWEQIAADRPVSGFPSTESTTWAAIRPEGKGMLTQKPVIHAVLVIHNKSKELIGPVRVRVIDRDTGAYLTDYYATVDHVNPESDHRVDAVFPNPKSPTPPWMGTEITFRDASGTWWTRTLSEPIRIQRSKSARFVYR